MAIHARITWNPDSAPIGIRNIPKNLGPIFVVDTTMMFPRADNSIGRTMCHVRSWVFDAWRVSSSDAAKVANHTGTVSKRVMVEE